MSENSLSPGIKYQLKKDLWALSYPSIIAFSLQGFYDIVDMIWVGKISAEAIAGVTLFSTIYALFGVLNEVAGASSVSMISQSYGRKTPERTQKIAEQTISFKVVLALITALLLAVFLKPLLRLYSDDPVVIRAAIDYGFIRILALPVAFSSYSINTVFRCTGDSKTPMKVMIVAALANMILDPVFMFETIPGTSLPGFNMGVFGAGLATVISTFLSFIFGFVILLRGHHGVTISIRGLFTLDKEIDKQLLSIGLPAGFQLFVRQGFNALLMGFITSYGTIAVTVYGLGSKIMGFSFTPIVGFQFAGSSMVGHALGRDHIEEADYIAKIATSFISRIIGVFAIFALTFPKFFLRIFNTDPEVLRQGAPMVRYIALAMVATSFAAGMRVVFSGSGFNRPILLSTMISRWLIQLPLMALLVYILQVPLHYLWLSFLIAELAELAVVIYYYKRGDWQTKRV